MVRRSLLFIGILLAGSTLSAKTPQALKAELDAFLPAGMKVRIVWSNCSVSGGPYTVYAYDSEENVIRELTPISFFASGRRNIADAYISQDGEYVVLKDEDSDYIQKIDFDGTDLKTLYTRGNMVCTWQDPVDKTQYLVASGLASPINTGTWAVGIADQTKRRQISTKTYPTETSQWAGGCGLSIDGKMIGGFDYDRPGLWPTPSGAFIPAAAGCQGCNFTMRPTTGNGVYEYGHWFDSHWELCVHNADGSKKEVLSNAITDPRGDEPQMLHFSNHVDYAMYMFEETTINPILYDLARTRWVIIKDDCKGFSREIRRPNAVLLAKTGVETRRAPAMTRISHVPHTTRKLYSIEGRLLSKRQFGASTFAVRSLRIPVGNQAVGIIVGCR